jgi:lipopolysaccharide export system protein LptC
VFHPLCYDNGREYLEHNSENIKILKMQINEFGQVPAQLFKKPHPQRFTNKIREIVITANESVSVKDNAQMKGEKDNNVVVDTKNKNIKNNNISNSSSNKVQQAHVEIKTPIVKSQTISNNTSSNTQSVKLPIIPTNFKLNKKFKHIEKVHNK